MYPIEEQTFDRVFEAKLTETHHYFTTTLGNSHSVSLLVLSLEI